MTTATISNPVITTTGLDAVATNYAKAIRNANYKLLAVKPKADAETAYIWRRVALEVSPKEALQRAITKVFTKDLSQATIHHLDTIAQAIVKATNDGIKAQAQLATMQVKEVDESEDTGFLARNENHQYGMGVCVDCQTCHHFWEIEMSGLNGLTVTSKGVCLHCGQVGRFFNSIHSQLKAKREELGVDADDMESVDENEELMELAMRDALSAMIDTSL